MPKLSAATDPKLVIAPVVEEREGFKLGDAWRPSDESLVALVPILRENGRPQRYITFPEAVKSGQVIVTDKGHISPVQVKNVGELPVLLRAGDIISGQTQERTFTKTTLIPEGVKWSIEVVCVHQTRPLVFGAEFETPDVSTPYSVRRPFYETRHDPVYGRQDLQSETWNRASGYGTAYFAAASMGGMSGDAVGTPTASPGGTRVDDLTQVQRNYLAQLKEVLKDMPKLEDQAGVAVLDIKGCQSLEVFDVAASFGALRESLIGQSESVGQKLEDLDQVFQFRPEFTGQALRQLLVDEFKVERVWENINGYTEHFEGMHTVGEYTFQDSEMVHLLVLRREG